MRTSSTPEDETLFAWRGGMSFIEMIGLGEMSINSAILSPSERKAAVKLFRSEWAKAIEKIAIQIPSKKSKQTVSSADSLKRVLS